MRTAIIGLLLSASPLLAQDDARQVFDSYFGKSRPAATGGAAQSKPEYRPATPARRTPAKQAGSTASKLAGSALGVTIWKMETPAARDDARLLVQAGGAATEFAPHRMEAGEPLKQGDRVRLSIETPADGYLYVVDQELRADGALGPPFLIFPTAITRGGDNHVRSGQLVEIPAQTDPLNVFLVQAKGPSDEGEHLSIILTPSPIPGLKLTPAAQELAKETFDSWVSNYRTDFQHLELVGGKGKSWTEAEKQAGMGGAKLLTQADPGPQTIFVFPERAGQPVMAVIRLQIQQR